MRPAARFAWVAGPGDIISGVFAYIAIRMLDNVAEYFGVSKRNLNVADVAEKLPTSIPEGDLRVLKRTVIIGIVLVAVGIAGFIVASASAAISFVLGFPATELTHAPLGFVPMLLVPQVFVLEVFAKRQLHVMRIGLRRYR